MRGFRLRLSFDCDSRWHLVSPPPSRLLIVDSTFDPDFG